MKNNIVELVGRDLLGGAGAGKKREVFVEFRETGGKAFERDFASFTYCTAYRSLLPRKGVNRRGINQVNTLG